METPPQAWSGKMQSLADQLIGRTITEIHAKPFDSGLHGACDALELRLSDGFALLIEAGSYAIPEESCLYPRIRVA